MLCQQQLFFSLSFSPSSPVSSRRHHPLPINSSPFVTAYPTFPTPTPVARINRRGCTLSTSFCLLSEFAALQIVKDRFPFRGWDRITKDYERLKKISRTGRILTIKRNLFIGCRLGGGLCEIKGAKPWQTRRNRRKINETSPEKGGWKGKDGSSFRGRLTREVEDAFELRLSRSVNQSVTPRRYGRLNSRNRIARLNCLLDYGVS